MMGPKVLQKQGGEKGREREKRRQNTDKPAMKEEQTRYTPIRFVTIVTRGE